MRLREIHRQKRLSRKLGVEKSPYLTVFLVSVFCINKSDSRLWLDWTAATIRGLYGLGDEDRAQCVRNRDVENFTDLHLCSDERSDELHSGSSVTFALVVFIVDIGVVRMPERDHS